MGRPTVDGRTFFQEVMVSKINLKVQKEFCSECSLAIMRFMKNMDGVESVVAEDGEVVITYNESKASGEKLEKIARDAVKTLGYKMEETDAGGS